MIKRISDFTVYNCIYAHMYEKVGWYFSNMEVGEL